MPISAASSLPPPPPLDPQTALFLDFDGTLIELAADPAVVTIGAELPGLLGRVADRLDGRLALVSGRSIAQLEGFLGDALTRFALAGSHGVELRPIGGAALVPVRPASLDAAEAAFSARFADRPAVLVERKSFGVGLHFRHSPDSAAEAEALVEEYAAAHGLAVQKGKMMVELRLAGQDKGSAVVAFASDAPFAGHRPVFLGDDLTDEAGFAAAARLGGYGILVGEPRPTAAVHHLPTVAAVHAWLDAVTRVSGTAAPSG